MYLNGIEVIGYNIDSSQNASLTFQNTTIDSIMSAVTDHMVFYDGAGAMTLTLTNFSIITSIEFVPNTNVYNVKLKQKTGSDADLADVKTQLEDTQSMLDAILMGDIEI